MTHDLGTTRREYAQGELRRAALKADPVAQFSLWLQTATDAQLVDATAMTLATVDATGQPSARIVLLKHFGATGYVFYTAYNSQKGRELLANPQATLLFYWREFERQVRISGAIGRVARSESEAYFDTRPVSSRYAAAASEQSAIIENRDILEARVAALEGRYPKGDVPLPQEWGGYCLKPIEYEFWQGRLGRLHDRFRYRLSAGDWLVERLQP